MEESEFMQRYRGAEAAGYKVPRNLDNLSWEMHRAWERYWDACTEYLCNPEKGRPIPPHRSG